MRVLITTAPGYGHLFAPVPLAWALRAAGHEVAFAAAARPEAGLDVAAWAGLPVVAVASAEQVEQVRLAMRATRLAEAERRGVTMPELQRLMREQARDAGRSAGNPFTFAAEIYGPLSEAMADGLVAFGRAWRPDVLVHETLQAGGPLAAAVLGIPAVEYTAGFYRGPELGDELAAYLAAHYAKHGVERPDPAVVLDFGPPSLIGAAGPGAQATPIRFTAATGAAVLDEWLWTRPERLRIAVTFGSVVPHRLGLAPARRILDAAATADAEFVLAAGVADPAEWGSLPANVRPVAGYLSLAALLPTCHAVIHHGGPATTFAALEAGLPQLVLPEMADQFFNAGLVTARGCGFGLEDGTVPPEALHRLLADAGLAAAADEVRAEIAGMPSPAAVVPTLTALR